MEEVVHGFNKFSVSVGRKLAEDIKDPERADDDDCRVVQVTCKV